MRRIPDRQKTGTMPQRQAVDRHSQKADFVKAIYLGNPAAQERRQLSYLGLKRRDISRARCLERALGDHIAALPMIAAIDHYQDATVVNAASRILRIAFLARNLEPEDVHGRSELARLEPGTLPDCRMTPVGCDNEIRTNFNRLIIRQSFNADYRVSSLEKVNRRCLHVKMESRVTGGVHYEKIQQIPLGHKGDELAQRFHATEVGDHDALVSDLRVKLVGFAVGQRQESVEQPKLMQDLKRRRMYCVTSKIAQEVRVFFEDDDVDARASQKKSGKKTGWSPAYNATASVDLRGIQDKAPQAVVLAL